MTSTGGQRHGSNTILFYRSFDCTNDTWMRQGYSTYNYGGATTISNSPNTSSRHNSLFLWDLPVFQKTPQLSPASLSFYVTDSSAYDFSLYRMRRTWVEGTLNGAASSSSTPGANWNYYNYQGGSSWGTAGAMSTTADRYSTDLWDATASTFGSSGDQTIALNSSGVSVIEDWYASSATNFGLTIQYSGSSSTSDYWVVASKENSSATPNLL